MTAQCGERMGIDMNDLERTALYRKAVTKWGLPLQLGMLMEECAELIHATHKVMRNGDKDVNTWRRLADEMADVEIMIEQIKVVCLGIDLRTAVETNKHDKLLRLQRMIEE